MKEQAMCCGTTCDKKKVAEYIAEMERRVLRPREALTYVLEDYTDNGSWSRDNAFMVLEDIKDE